jgi:hypothetical protein
VPATIVPRVKLDLIESTAVSSGRNQECSKLPAASLQNPTEWHPDSPFFGNLRTLDPLLLDFLVGSIGGHNLEFRSRGKNWNIVIVTF